MINYINFLYDRHLLLVDEKDKNTTPMDVMDRQLINQA